MTDFHIHSVLSGDGKSTHEDNIKSALEKGCKYIAFTEHCNLDFLKHGYHEIPTTDLGLYDAEYKRLKAKYRGRIEIAYGLEIGFDPSLSGEYNEIVKKYDYDYIINSIHLINGMDSYWQTFFHGRPQKEAYEEYLGAIYESLSAPYRFDSIGHLGYVTRTSPYPGRDMFAGYEAHIEAILKKMIEKGVILELNTNLRDAPPPCLPQKEIVQFYKKLGGELVIFGSDAHYSSHICHAREQVMELLKACGFKYHCIFIGKERKMIKI